MSIYLNGAYICKLGTSSMEISRYLRLLLKLQNWGQLMLVHNLLRTGRCIHYNWVKAGVLGSFRSYSTHGREGHKFNRMVAQSLGSRVVILTIDWNVIPCAYFPSAPMSFLRAHAHTYTHMHTRTRTHVHAHSRAHMHTHTCACSRCWSQACAAYSLRVALCPILSPAVV